MDPPSVSAKRRRKLSRAMLRSRGLPSDEDVYVGATSSDSSDSESSESEAGQIGQTTLNRSAFLSPPLESHPTRSATSSQQPSPTMSVTSLPPWPVTRPSTPVSQPSTPASRGSTPEVSQSGTVGSGTPGTRVTSSLFRTASTSNLRLKFEERFKCATTSNEDVLKLQMKSWKSSAYAHFTMPPEISEDSNGNVMYYYKCLTRPSTGVHRARHDESTSNLQRHVAQCTPANSQEAKALRVYAQGSKYDEATHRMKIALWIARRNRPFSIVEDEELQEIFLDLNAACVTPKRRTVSRDIQEMFLMSRKNVSAVLQAYPGKIHLCADGWTTPNVIAFIGATVHWIVDGKMASAILDFIKASQAHTGVYLAARIAECLREYGIQDKILGFTADNASNNDTLVSELSNLIPTFKGARGRARCFAHILNLVVKAILSPFSQARQRNPNAIITESDEEIDRELEKLDDSYPGDGLVGDEDPDPEDDDPLAPDIIASDASAVDDIISEVELNNRLTPLSTGDSKLGKITINKLRALANKIVNSPTLRADLSAACVSTNIEPKQMVRDVSTRWNSTAELVQRALDLKPPLNVLVIKAEHNRPRGVRLARFRLLEAEWNILKQLSPLLEIFLYATKKISESNTPLIHQVVPMIDSLTAALDQHIDNISLHPVVRHAALRGLLMLNKYYARTDESIVYRIAMVLHPRHKTAYFSKAGWLREWIDEAERLTREEWIKNYKPQSLASELEIISPATNDRFSDARRFFSDLDDNIGPIDALDDWLANAVISTSADPIVYWTAQNTAGHPLARMALDFLSIPASSTDVERSFSKGGQTVSRFRHNLGDASVRASAVLGSWCTLDGVIDRPAIINMLKKKKTRNTAKKRKPNPPDADVIVLNSN